MSIRAVSNRALATPFLVFGLALGVGVSLRLVAKRPLTERNPQRAHKHLETSPPPNDLS